MQRIWRRRKLLGTWNKHHTRVNQPFSSKRWKKLQCIKFVVSFNTKEPMFKQLSISSLNHIILIFFVLPIARKKQGLLKIEAFYDCPQMSSVGIFQYPTSSQSNKRGILPTIESYTGEVLKHLRSATNSPIHIYLHK